LGYPLSYQPKYGSAPTESVNALTYYVEAEKQRVTLFNSELFRFGGQIAQLTVQTIPLENIHDPAGVIDARATQIIADFFAHPQWRADAVSAGRILLGIPTGALSPLDQKYDEIATPLVAGMDLFVVGHEFGHIIKRDDAPFNAPQETEAMEHAAKVAAWTWPQELRADQIGIKLVARALRDTASQAPEIAAQARFALRGALLFMECLDIVADTAFVKRAGHLPRAPSAQEKAYLRAFADGKLSALAASRALGGPLDPYPPPWLRRERLEKAVVDLEKSLPDSQLPIQNARLADALLSRMGVFWAMARRDLENVDRVHHPRLPIDRKLNSPPQQSTPPQ
jgi:hypothetical protein